MPGYLDDRLLSDGAGAPLAGVEPLFHREAASMGLQPLDQQVVDRSEVVVAFILKRLKHSSVNESFCNKHYW